MVSFTLPQRRCRVWNASRALERISHGCATFGAPLFLQNDSSWRRQPEIGKYLQDTAITGELLSHFPGQACPVLRELVAPLPRDNARPLLLRHVDIARPVQRAVSHVPATTQHNAILIICPIAVWKGS